MKELSELLKDLPTIAPGAGKVYKQTDSSGVEQDDCAIFCVDTEPKQYFVIGLEKTEMLGKERRQHARVYKVKYQIIENPSKNEPEVIENPKFILKTWWRAPFRREAKFTRRIYNVAAYALTPNLKEFENVLIREDLGDICVDEAKFTFAEYLDFAIKFLESIQFHHGKKILLRDIKERNTLLANNNADVRMIDHADTEFINRLYQRKLRGTKLYWSPEEYKIYSLYYASDNVRRRFTASVFFPEFLQSIGLSGKNKINIDNNIELHSKAAQYKASIARQLKEKYPTLSSQDNKRIRKLAKLTFCYFLEKHPHIETVRFDDFKNQYHGLFLDLQEKLKEAKKIKLSLTNEKIIKELCEYYLYISWIGVAPFFLKGDLFVNEKTNYFHAGLLLARRLSLKTFKLRNEKVNNVEAYSELETKSFLDLSDETIDPKSLIPLEIKEGLRTVIQNLTEVKPENRPANLQEPIKQLKILREKWQNSPKNEQEGANLPKEQQEIAISIIESPKQQTTEKESFSSPPDLSAQAQKIIKANEAIKEDRATWDDHSGKIIFSGIATVTLVSVALGFLFSPLVAVGALLLGMFFLFGAVSSFETKKPNKKTIEVPEQDKFIDDYVKKERRIEKSFDLELSKKPLPKKLSASPKSSAGTGLGFHNTPVASPSPKIVEDSPSPSP